jgi:DNA-binding PadR family transcriptional regulator
MARRRTEGGILPQEFLPLSNPEFHILLAIADSELHGYAIMQDVRESTNGAVRLGPGTLYRCIQDLLRKGLIEESDRRPAPGEDQRRHYYRLSSMGSRVLSAEARRLSELVAIAKSKRVLGRAPSYFPVQK